MGSREWGDLVALWSTRMSGCGIIGLKNGHACEDPLWIEIEMDATVGGFGYAIANSTRFVFFYYA